MTLKNSFLCALFWGTSLVLCWPVSTCYGEKVSAVASIFPVADMVKQVGGNYVDVMTIIPPGASPHTFTLKPSQVKRISFAQIYFAIGAGLEILIDKVIPLSQGSIKQVVLSDGIPLIYGLESNHHEEYSAGHQHHDIANPHIWLDPQIAKLMVGRIISNLSEIDAAHRQYYEQNGRLYQQKLDELDLLIKNSISQFTIKQYVSFHPAWVYFAKRYGLESVGIIESSPGTNSTLRTTMKIVNQIKTRHIRAVFAEPQLNPKVAEVIAKEANAKVLFLDPIGSPNLEDRRTYIDLMKYNLKILQEAMK